MTRQILICDDEVHIIRAAEFKLKRAGYDVRCAADGEQGWQAIRAECPDLLITDYQMPRLDGLGLIQRLRAEPATRHLPVVMLTAKGFHLPRQQMAQEWDVTEVLPKPFSPRQLLATVERLLEPPDACPVSCPDPPAGGLLPARS